MNSISNMEKVRFVLIDCITIGVVSYLFYESVIAFVFLILAIPMLYKRQKNKLHKRQKSMIRKEFKDFCNVLSNNLAVGYSFENALSNSINESRDLYGKNSYMVKELRIVANKVNINIPVEKAFMEFAMKTDVEDIVIFAEILSMAKRSSGNVVEVIRNTIDNIAERIELKREIETIFSSKRYEQRIMNIIPLLIICYVKLTSPEMLNIMYSTLLGRIIMSICLIVFISALLLGEKIMNMEDYV